MPRWMKEQKVEGGWITAEYSMLPYSTLQRKPRDITKGRLDGRSQEIQRLIGRAMRAALDLEKLGTRTIWVDCDVLQADGGTRTAAITGAYVAVYQVALKIKDLLGLGELPLFDSLSAISVGVVDGRTLLDLDYEEDSAAAVDMNVVMTGEGKLVEVQATAEGEPYARKTLDEMLELAAAGAAALAAAQAAAVEALG